MRAEHHQALADLETGKRQALAGLRAQLAQTTAEQSGLAARVEELERERDHMIGEHHQALADLEISKREALAERERVLTEVQTPVVSETQTVLTDVEPLHELFDAADATFVRQLVGIDEPAPKATDGKDAVLGKDTVLGKDAVLGEDAVFDKDAVFDSEDDAFVRSLIEGTHAAADGEPRLERPETPPSRREDS
jgi:hypothetical protein